MTPLASATREAGTRTRTPPSAIAKREFKDLPDVGGDGFGAVDAAVEADDALEVVVFDGFEQADLGGERFAVGLAERICRLRLLLRVVFTTLIPAFSRLRDKGRKADQFAVGDP